MIHVYFEEIRSKIIDLLDEAEVEIRVSMAWLTNKALFQVLVNKASAGKKVLVVISDSPSNFMIRQSGRIKIDFEELIRKGGVVRIVRKYNSAFFHHKFAVIDEKNVITGSYNWSNGAEVNHENIVVTDDPGAVQRFGKQHKEYLFRKSVSYVEFMANFKVETPEFDQLEAQDDESFLLAEEFERLVQVNMKKGQQLGVKVNFDRLQIKIKQYTAVGAAKKLVTEEDKKGYIELASINKLELSFEFLVAQAKFASLFEPSTIKIAKEKLKKYGFVGNFDA